MEDPELQGRDLRCSDKDRERVAEALREAAGDGRLTLSELEERLDATFKARTYGDLQPITRDLPQGPYPIPSGQPGANLPVPDYHSVPATRPSGAAPAPVSQRIRSILGSEKRGGRWEVPDHLEITSYLGDVTVDFSQAIVRSRRVTVQVGVVLGSVKLIVPDGIDVRLEPGTNILSDCNHRLAGPVTPGGPVYWVRGYIVLGELSVRPPKQKRSLFGSS